MPIKESWAQTSSVRGVSCLRNSSVTILVCPTLLATRGVISTINSILLLLWDCVPNDPSGIGMLEGKGTPPVPAVQCSEMRPPSTVYN